MAVSRSPRRASTLAWLIGSVPRVPGSGSPRSPLLDCVQAGVVAGGQGDEVAPGRSEGRVPGHDAFQNGLLAVVLEPFQGGIGVAEAGEQLARALTAQAVLQCLIGVAGRPVAIRA